MNFIIIVIAVCCIMIGYIYAIAELSLKMRRHPDEFMELLVKMQQRKKDKRRMN